MDLQFISGGIGLFIITAATWIYNYPVIFGMLLVIDAAWIFLFLLTGGN